MLSLGSAEITVSSRLSAASIGLELWVWYDGQSLTKRQVLSRLYFSISDRLASHGIKVA